MGIVDPMTLERVLLHGDLQKLTSSQKVSYYRAVCESVGLNPLTQPFQYIILNGKETLYARREATEQLRQIHQVSIEIRARELVDDIYVVTARATLPTGRTDENIGCVPLGALKGEARANAMMKAETKSKRRVTLAICGLGLLDETEESLPPTVAAPALEPSMPSARITGVGVRESSASRVSTAPGETTETPQAAELPPDLVRVVGFETKKTKNPAVWRYEISFSNGELLTTINSLLANMAEEAFNQQTPVRITSRQTRWGNELLSIRPGDEPAPEPLPLDDDMPF